MLATAMIVPAVSANPRNAIMIGYESADNIENFQEDAACKMFMELNPDGGIITAGDFASITTEKYDCIWIHIDRLNQGKGNLPAEFVSNDAINALKKFLADGGNIYLSKQATQMLVNLDRVDAKFAPGIYGDGDGGLGADVWTLQAQIGYWFVGYPDSDHYDPAQYYDHRGHAIYNGLETSNAFEWETFGMEGTGNGTEMHREDHNCMWDLNAYAYEAEGRNTVEKFENENKAVVLGTWGHVQDHAVAAIIEFLPEVKAENASRATVNAGRIIANGLAAYELAPRSGVNAYAGNIKQLTANIINYLQSNSLSGVTDVEAAETAGKTVYYNLQGVEVNPENPAAGIYVVRQGNSVKKVLVK